MTIKQTMDPRSRDLYRGDEFLGKFGWHKTPAIRLRPGVYLTIEEMGQIIQFWELVK